MWETFCGEAVDTFFWQNFGKDNVPKIWAFLRLHCWKVSWSWKFKEQDIFECTHVQQDWFNRFHDWKGMSFESLDLNQKIRVLILQFWIIVLILSEVFWFSVMFWHVLIRYLNRHIGKAVYRDHPEVLDALLEFIHGHSLRGLVCALSVLITLRSLNTLKAKGIFWMIFIVYYGSYRH